MRDPTKKLLSTPEFTTNSSKHQRERGSGQIAGKHNKRRKRVQQVGSVCASEATHRGKHADTLFEVLSKDQQIKSQGGGVGGGGGGGGGGVGGRGYRSLLYLSRLAATVGGR